MHNKPNNGGGPQPTLNLNFGPGDLFLIISVKSGTKEAVIFSGEFQRDIDNLALATSAAATIAQKMHQAQPDERRIVPANPGLKPV